MTFEKVCDVARQYQDLIQWMRDASGREQHSEDDMMRVRLSVVANHRNDIYLAHLQDMCFRIIEFMREGRNEKAMRWLGFVQGCLWMLGAKSIEELARDNMPADAAFDETR